MDLVSWTLGGGRSNPDRPILIDALSPVRSLSLRQIVRKVRQLIHGLQSVGTQPGDCVCVNCFNNLEYSVLYLGIIGSGAIFTGVNPSYTPNELRHHFELTKPSLLIVEPAMLEKSTVAAGQTGIPTDRIYVFDTLAELSHQDIRSWTSLLDQGESDWVKVQNPDTTVATYNSTSGTSGLPKAAMITHSYHVNQAAAQCAGTEHTPLRLLTLPPFHAFGSPILPSSIRQGIPTYIMRRYAEAPFLTSIEQYSITETYVAPPVLMGLPKSALATRERLSSLRTIWMGGASVKFAQQKPLYDLLHADACIRSVWGMTEAGWITCVQDRTRREDDSVGQPLDGFNISIADDKGQPILADNISGELLVHAPHPLLSYIFNPSATAAAFLPHSKTGTHWLRTGDIGYRVTDPVTGIPSLYIVDRAKDLIKVRGWQVSPTEIESELLRHHRLADAAVIGIKAPDGVDELIRAYVVVLCGEDDEDEVDELMLRAWLCERLAGYKVPAQFVFVAAVPRNGTGKILRHVLREQEQEGAKSLCAHRRVDSVIYETASTSALPVLPGINPGLLPMTESSLEIANSPAGTTQEAMVARTVGDPPQTLAPPLPEDCDDEYTQSSSGYWRLRKCLSTNVRVAVDWKHSYRAARKGFGRR